MSADKANRTNISKPFETNEMDVILSYQPDFRWESEKTAYDIGIIMCERKIYDTIQSNDCILHIAQYRIMECIERKKKLFAQNVICYLFQRLGSHFFSYSYFIQILGWVKRKFFFRLSIEMHTFYRICTLFMCCLLCLSSIN